MCLPNNKSRGYAFPGDKVANLFFVVLEGAL